MKPPLRTKSVGTKVSETDALLEERARGAGMRLGEWVLEAMLLSGEPQSSGDVLWALGESFAV
jgi:hypothetical protein